MIDIVEVAIGAIVGVGVSYSLFKIRNKSKEEHFLEQYRAKAKVIEHEAEKLLQDAKIRAKEIELEAKSIYDEKLESYRIEHEKRMQELQQKDENLNQLFKDELKNITLEKSEIKSIKDELTHREKELEDIKKLYEKKILESEKLIEKSAGLTKEEAREIVLQRAEDEARGEIAHIVRKYEVDAKQQAKRRANYIIAQATTRFAGDYASERLINTVTLPSDDIKGRIIGREGRNIKSLESVLGVDIIIDDTPNTIILSSFNLYRRAIATKVLEELISDGRIQPARIEDIHNRVVAEFEAKIQEEGENIVFDLGLNDMHPEIIKLIGKLKFRASYGQNALGHSLEVAHLASIIAAECGGDEKLANRAWILHYIGKALTHD